MKNAIIVDTREPFEYAASHVEGAINIPLSSLADGSLPSELADTEKDREIILYCRTGQRSNTVGHLLRNHGFTHLTNGINEHHVKKRLNEQS